MPIEIEPLKAAHLPDAAMVFAAGFREERSLVPALPPRHDDGSTMLPLLEALLAKAPGVAAFQGPELCGYLIGMPIDSFKGTARAAYVPIWAHAAAAGDRTALYLRMYEELAREWVANGWLTHAITLFAHDSAGSDVWFRNCFGLLGVDALRSLDDVSGSPDAPSHIRQAGVSDLDLIMPLARSLDLHLAASPVFLPPVHLLTREEYAAWLDEPAHTLWLAECDGHARAFMRTQPPPDDVAFVVSDPQTISITGAFTTQEWRGQAVGAMLLRQIIEWARARGYARCSVDFESQNISGSRFWLRHFQPVCHSLMRRIDERIAVTHTPPGSQS